MDHFEHGGDVYRNRNVRLDFSVNTNARGMPQTVKTALLDNVDACSRYPDPHCQQLVDKISEQEGVPTSHILCGNGAADLIYNIVFALKPKRALLLAPSFSEYERALSAVDCHITYHRLRAETQFNLTRAIFDQLTPDIDVLFLCQPNNPTGRLIEPGLLKEVLRQAKANNTNVIIDECFLDFTTASSAKSYLEDMPNLVVLKAFTKIYSLAGLRLGYLLTANEKLIQEIKTKTQCWTVSVPAQIAGLAALECDDWLKDTIHQVRSDRELFSDELISLGLTVYESEANFILLESEIPLYESLLQRGILIRRAANFIGLNERFYRVAVKTTEENAEFIQAIKEVLNG